MAIIIFGIIISIVFFLRATCEANELFYGPICDNIPMAGIFSPDFPSYNNVSYNKYDKKVTFKSAIAYFLERYENSPPI